MNKNANYTNGGIAMNNITVPKRGMGISPFAIVEWTAKEGEKIEQGRPVVVLESEKVTHEVTAEISGYLHILYEEGKELPIGTVIAVITETKEELEILQKQKPADATHRAETEETEKPAAQLSEPRNGERLRILPAARRLAKEQKINISSIRGTGPGGSIVKKDIEMAIKRGEGSDTDKGIYQGKRIKSTIPLSGMRKRIAEHMHRSFSLSAHVNVMGEIDMSEMIQVRESLLKKQDSIGSRITYTDLFVYLTARTLKDHEIINSSLVDNEIKIWDSINIGVATALDEGLIVPVVKNADRRTLPEISQTIKKLVKKAREGKLSSDEVTGGTFTITNLGALGAGYRFETPIINQPESAILGTGGITQRAVVLNNKIVIRPLMTYYLTYDHRVINGLDATNFIKSLTETFEDPEPFLS